MPGGVIGKSLNLGYAGSVSRSADAIIANRIVKLSDVVSINFGDPAILNTDNTYSKFGATGTAAAFAGIAVREVKQGTVYGSNANGSYAPGDPCDVLGRGSVTVVCNVGTPVAGGPVYIRTLANGAIPLGVVGGFEAASDTTNSILITNAKWTTGKIDANKVAEVTITQRNNP
jgi:hypothetical protein